jgi:hypothetical protein
MNKTAANPIIILGSSRRNGNTAWAVREIIGDSQIPIVDLLDLSGFAQ